MITDQDVSITIIIIIIIIKKNQRFFMGLVPGGLMVKWLVSVRASIAERISGISSNPAEDLALAGINHA